jgi:ribonuclease-3
MTYSAFCQHIGYTFRDRTLLTQALTHTSAGGAHFQRLEFLGDRVLGLVIAQWLYKEFPKEPEGLLAKRFVEMAKKNTLVSIAQAMHLERYIHVDTRTVQSEGILADACEAVLGAIYLDQGLQAAMDVIEGFWRPFMSCEAIPIDAKSRLQELLQSQGRALPLYTLIKQHGPSHCPEFQIQVILDDQTYFTGKGPSRRKAEQEAATQALQALNLSTSTK